jgi:PAS domain S-box-containing protein
MEDKKTIEKLLNELMEMSCAIVELRESVTKFQKEAESLRADEQRYKAIFENIPQKLFVKDKDAAYLLSNESYARGLQIPKEEIAGKKDSDLFPAEVAEEQNNLEKRIMATGKAESFTRSIREQGEEKSFLGRKVPLKDEKGNIIGILGLEEEDNMESPGVRQPESILETKAELERLREEIQREISQRRQAEEKGEKGGETAQRLSQENALLTELGRILTEKSNLGEICEYFSVEISKLIPFERMTIGVPNLAGGTITMIYTAGVEIATRRMGDTFPLSKTGEEEVMKNRSSLLLQQEYPEEVLGRFEVFLPYFRAGFQSLLLVPLSEKDQVIGVLSFLATRQNAYTREDVKLAERLGILLAKALGEDRLRRQCQRAEENLRESEAALHPLLEFNPDAIFSLDLEGRVLKANPASSRMTGYTPEELTHKSFLSLVSPESATVAREHFQKAIQGEMQDDRIALSLKDGGRRETRLILLPIRVGETIVGGYGIAREPLAREQGESEIAPMIRHAPIGIWIYLDGMLKFANPKCAEILGYSRDELTSKPLTEFLHPEDRKMVLERYAGWQTGKTPPNVYASRFIHKEGFVKWLESKVAFISWQGKPAIINYLTDITERMWTRETMGSLMEQLRAQLKCIEDIVYTWDRE